MSRERRARLFRIGRDQAIRIPREFEFPGDEALMRMEDGSLVITPAKPRTLTAILDSLEPIDEELPDIPDAPPKPVDP